MHNKMPSVPPDMEFDVAEEECMTQGKSSEDTEKYIQVNNKRKRIEAKLPPKSIDVSTLYGQNYFRILGDLDIESTPSSSNQHKTNKDSTTNTSEKQPPTRKAFCPPIFLHNVNVKLLVEQLGARTPPITFKIRNVSRNKSKLFFADPLIHADMMRLLKEKQISAYSFTPMEFRQTSLIMRGLYHGCEVSEIKEELNRIVPGVVCNVTKYTTKHSHKNDYDTGLFLVTLNPGKSITDVTNIKEVLRQIIKWEKPNKKDKEVQCHRCQKWGHIAKNCSAEFKCVKCDQKHAPGECSRVSSEESAPHCVNCGELGHPANWRGCPSYKTYVKSKKDRSMMARMEKFTAAKNVNKAISSGLRVPDKTFAQLFHPQQYPSQPQENKSGIIDEFLKLTAYFMEPEELSLEDEITNFMRDYRKQSKQDAKTEFLRLLHKVRHHGP